MGSNPVQAWIFFSPGLLFTNASVVFITVKITFILLYLQFKHMTFMYSQLSKYYDSEFGSSSVQMYESMHINWIFSLTLSIDQLSVLRPAKCMFCILPAKRLLTNWLIQINLSVVCWSIKTSWFYDTPCSQPIYKGLFLPLSRGVTILSSFLYISSDCMHSFH